MTVHATRLDALGRGFAAGAAGTGALTLAQLLEAKATRSEPPAAAGIVAKRVLESVFMRSVGDERLPMLNQVTHWTYGLTWGGLYGLAQSRLRLPTVVSGGLFGLAVGTAATGLLPALQLMPPPHQVPPRVLATSTLQHLLYGVVSAGTYRMLSRLKK